MTNEVEFLFCSYLINELRKEEQIQYVLYKSKEMFTMPYFSLYCGQVLENVRNFGYQIEYMEGKELLKKKVVCLCFG